MKLYLHYHYEMMAKYGLEKPPLLLANQVEVEVLHPYEPKEEVDTVHGEPYHAILPGNKSIAITQLRNLVDVPIEINGTGISSGTLEFVGSALVFHKTTGQPFTVTYSIDVVAKPTINQI